MKILLLVLLGVGPLGAQTLFTQTGNAPFSAGLGPYYALTRDFNGDGIPDLAFQDEGNGQLTVLLGDGKGGFVPGPGSPYRCASHASGLVAADFNRDGFLDLVCESSLAGPNFLGQGSISILLGDGTGGFTLGPGYLYPVLTDGSSGSIATGDFNGDGNPDLALSNGNGLVLLLGDGTGNFSVGPSPSSSAVNGLVAVGDFAGNGRSDIVVVNSQGVRVFVSNGHLSFQALPLQPAGTAAPNAIAVADFNRDGALDLLVGGNGSAAILLGDGKGGFQAKSSVPYSAGSTPMPFAIADFNGDGYPDLAITESKTAAILLGNGDGSFSAQAAAQFAITIPDTVLGLTGDFNGDGKPDFLLSDGRVWLNTLPAITVNPKSISLLTGTQPVAVTLTGVTGQLAVRSNQIWLSYANGHVSANATGLKPGTYHGTLSFSAPNEFGVTLQVTLTVSAPSGTLMNSGAPLNIYGDVYVGDFNGDGKPDLLTVTSGVFAVAFGDGAGSFAISPAAGTFANGGSPVLADFNLDGHLDIAWIAGEAESAHIPFTVYLGDGTGNFPVSQTTGVPPYPYPLGAATPLTADFNLDGIPDLFIGGFVYLGDGKGGFHQVPPLFEAGQTYQAVTGDFNGDGIPDVAYTVFASSQVYICLGDGTGRLNLFKRFDFAQRDTALGLMVAGDWNSDGITDLAIASTQYPGLIEILFGAGTGDFRFGPQLAATRPNRVDSLSVVDLNGDGALDLAVLSMGNTSIFFGDGLGGFALSTGGTLPGGSAIQVADFNLDGRLDLIAGVQSGQQVLLGGLAQPALMLTEVPPNPFNVGQTVSLMAQVVPDPHGFQTPTGVVELMDGASVTGLTPLQNGFAYFLTAFVPRVHHFTATYVGDTRDAAVSAGLALIESGPPAAIQALGNGFPLRALVTDGNNNPVPGVRVLFSAPGSGAGGTFAGTQMAAVLTDSQGIATAPPFIPNGTPGSYTISASTTIGGFVCSFSENN